MTNNVNGHKGVRKSHNKNLLFGNHRRYLIYSKASIEPIIKLLKSNKGERQLKRFAEFSKTVLPKESPAFI